MKVRWYQWVLWAIGWLDVLRFRNDYRPHGTYDYWTCERLSFLGWQRVMFWYAKGRDGSSSGMWKGPGGHYSRENKIRECASRMFRRFIELTPPVR